jgi:glycosyltransferase involved in cell wall biosynthesis
MKISIAMATYNGAKYLQEQLDSFISQTRQPDELVVCDDRSTDETVTILNRFAEAAPFEVKIIVNEENLGCTQNFNNALSLCKGDLIFLSDQDDVWLPQKIAKIEEIVEQDSYNQIFIHDAELVHEDLSPTGLTKQGQVSAAGLPESKFVIGCCMAIRQNFLKYLLPIPTIYPYFHDGWLAHFGRNLQRVRIIPESFQLYRRHGNNTSRGFTSITRKINIFDIAFNKSKKREIIGIFYRQHTKWINAIDILESRIKVLDKWCQETDDELLKVDLFQFRASQQSLKQILKERVAIAQKPFLERIFYAYKLHQRGGYKQFSGVRSYIRDVLG